MKLLWLYFISILTAPFVGVVHLYISGENFYAGTVDTSLVISYSFNLFLILSITIFFSNFGLKKRKLDFKEYAQRIDPMSVLKKSLLIIIIGGSMVFILGGNQILTGVSDKGQLRSTIGIFGFLYKWIYLYLTPGLIVLNTVIFILYDRPKKLRLKLFLLYTFGLFVGFMTGYKFTIVTILIPGMVMFTLNQSSKKLIVILLLCFIFIIGATYYHQSYDSPLYYLYHRATQLAAAGSIGIWNEFPDGVGFNGFFYNFMSIFGNKINSFLVGTDTSGYEYLKYDMSRFITYLVYPDKQGALEGRVNLTVTNLGEGIYLFGKKLHFLFAIFSGIICGITIRKIKRSLNSGYLLKTTLITTYFFSIIVPWLNSGGVFSLFSIPVIVGFIFLYIVLRLTLVTFTYRSVIQ